MQIRLWATARDLDETQRKKLAKRIRRNGFMPKDAPIELVDIPDDYVPTAAEMQKSKRGGVDGG